MLDKDTDRHLQMMFILNIKVSFYHNFIREKTHFCEESIYHVQSEEVLCMHIHPNISFLQLVFCNQDLYKGKLYCVMLYTKIYIRLPPQDIEQSKAIQTIDQSVTSFVTVSKRCQKVQQICMRFPQSFDDGRVGNVLCAYSSLMVGIQKIPGKKIRKD